jgi:uncharacterized phiE125 gp8 family phage protein
MLSIESGILEYGTTHFRSEPALPAASIDDLKALLRLDDGSGEYSEDGYLLSLLLSASQFAARFLSRSLITTELTRQYDRPYTVPGLAIESKESRGAQLSYPPIESVDKVYTLDDSGNETVINDYYFDKLSGRVYIKSGVTGRVIDMLRIEYTAGYGEAYASVPQLIQQGIIQHAAYMYEHRGDCPVGDAAAQSGAKQMYGSYRAWVI